MRRRAYAKSVPADRSHVTSEEADNVNQEIAANKELTDATVAEHWPTTFEGLD
jgi:hypothetical protein